MGFQWGWPVRECCLGIYIHLRGKENLPPVQSLAWYSVTISSTCTICSSQFKVTVLQLVPFQRGLGSGPQMSHSQLKLSLAGMVFLFCFTVVLLFKEIWTWWGPSLLLHTPALFLPSSQGLCHLSCLPYWWKCTQHTVSREVLKIYSVCQLLWRQMEEHNYLNEVRYTLPWDILKAFLSPFPWWGFASSQLEKKILKVYNI